MQIKYTQSLPVACFLWDGYYAVNPLIKTNKEQEKRSELLEIKKTNKPITQQFLE